MFLSRRRYQGTIRAMASRPPPAAMGRPFFGKAGPARARALGPTVTRETSALTNVPRTARCSPGDREGVGGADRNSRIVGTATIRGPGFDPRRLIVGAQLEGVGQPVEGVDDRGESGADEQARVVGDDALEPVDDCGEQVFVRCRGDRQGVADEADTEHRHRHRTTGDTRAAGVDLGRTGGIGSFLGMSDDGVEVQVNININQTAQGGSDARDLGYLEGYSTGGGRLRCIAGSPGRSVRHLPVGRCRRTQMRCRCPPSCLLRCPR